MFDTLEWKRVALVQGQIPSAEELSSTQIVISNNQSNGDSFSNNSPAGATGYNSKGAT